MSDNPCLRGGDRESPWRDDIIIAENIVCLRGDMDVCLCLLALFPLLFWAVLSVVLCGFVCPSGLLFSVPKSLCFVMLWDLFGDISLWGQAANRVDCLWKNEDLGANKSDFRFTIDK